MSYRRTKSYSAERLRAMQSSRDRSRMAGPAPTYPPALPDMRIRITVERFDHGEQRHVIELHRTGRVDVYRATVDGQPCEGICPPLSADSPQAEPADGVLFPPTVYTEIYTGPTRSSFHSRGTEQSWRRYCLGTPSRQIIAVLTCTAANTMASITSGQSAA